MKKVATAAVAGAMALIPAGAAFASTGAVVPVANNYYLNGCNTCGGYGYGGGYGIHSGGLGQLFVLGSLFGGPYGNGVIGPTGTSLGDLLMLDQIFHNSNGFGWGY